MSQETIAQVLSVEEAAVGLYDDAQRQAASVIAEAKKAASTMREQTLANVRQQAEKMAAESRQTAEIERARIIAQADAEGQHMENLAAQHMDRAVSLVLDRVAGRE